jgi:epoxyqueuosine reductase
MRNLVQRSTFIKTLSAAHGFSFCGITKAEFLEDEAPQLERWLNNNYHGEMKWMENHFDKRCDPSLLVPGAKSVISFLYNYMPDETQEEGLPKISKYAYGDDYHRVIKDKLVLLMQELEEEFGEINGRVFVDSAPVLERALAAKAGLGWVGKHSLLINKAGGSFFFIAQLISDLELQVDNPVLDHCGTCTACIDACPTDAIVANRVVDARKCISYLTIELKNEIPTEFSSKMNGWVFGCDICQDVCPWNRFSKPNTEPKFEPKPEILKNNWEDWLEITEDVFKQVFKKSAVQRTKYSGFLRNLQVAKDDGLNG